MRPDDHIVMVPIAVVVEPKSDRERQPERDERAWLRRGLRVDYGRLVNGHVDDLRIRRDNLNDPVICDHVLLGTRLQVTHGRSLCAQLLNLIHDIGLLIEKSLA
jgi:hypothetical protein